MSYGRHKSFRIPFKEYSKQRLKLEISRTVVMDLIAFKWFETALYEKFDHLAF